MKIPFIQQIIKENGNKILIYPAVKQVGDDFDPWEKNYEYVDMNPYTLKGYVSMISPEALVWKQYGLQEMGAIEILCEAKYKNWFKVANKVVVNGEEYSVFKTGTNNRVLIQDRPYNNIRVILQRKG
jgi:glutathione peroxidase-family protein